MQIDDIKLDKKKTDPRLMQIIDQAVEIINQGLYEQKTYSQPPASGDPGFEGEVRNCISGSTMQVCKYVNGQWWASDATVPTGWSLIT